MKNYIKSRLSLVIVSAIVVLQLCYPQQSYAQDKNAQGIVSKMNDMLKVIADYDYEKSRSWMPAFRELMVLANQSPDVLPAIEQQMIGFLHSDAGKAGKQFICMELGITGTAASVPVLSEMLKNLETANMSLLALERITAPEAGEVLRKALKDPGIPNHIAIINSLAVREDEAAINELKPLIRSSDPKLAEAAVNALGAIGGKEAAKILDDYSQKAGSDIKWLVYDALLRCADKFVIAGDRKTALPLYEKVYTADPPLTLKAAALTGKFLAGDEDPASFLASHLRDEDPAFHPRVIRLVHLMWEPRNLGVIFDMVPGLPPASRMYLFVALAEEGDTSVRQVILQAVNDEDPVIKTAALSALPAVGKDVDALVLATIASGNTGKIRDIARRGLDMLAAPGTDQIIMNTIGTAQGSVKTELIRSCGERNMTGTVDMLVACAADPDPEVRFEAIRALGKLASPDYLAIMVDVLIQPDLRKVQQEAERAVLAITGKIPEKSNRTFYILKILPSVTNEKAIISLFGILGNIGNAEDLPVMRTYLSTGSDEVQLAVIRAFSGWPDASPLPDLRTLAESTDNPGKHSLAMRGYVDLILTEGAYSADEQLIQIKHAFGLTKDLAEKKTVLSGLGNIGTLDALDMAMGLLEDPDLKKEAEAAAVRIADNTSWGFPAETRARLTKLLETTDNEQIKTSIKEIFERI